jgi:cephalosporin hydroxylase
MEYFKEFVDTWLTEYPKVPKRSARKTGRDDALMVGFVSGVAEAIRGPLPKRFEKLEERSWGMTMTFPWLFPNYSPGSPGYENLLALSYKGLFNVKTPYDLALYGRLLWELKPRTILEFGAYHGGSSLWLADQLDTMAPGGQVHSFDINIECISKRARHPKLTFHRCDLTNLASLDSGLLKRLPHPWLVIDDAHVNVLGLFKHLDRHLIEGDYYVIEDVPVNVTADVHRMFGAISKRGYQVDTYYADAFSYNMTAAPNAWLRKMRKPGRKAHRKVP